MAEDFADLYLPLEGRDAEISLVGLIGLPELARPVASTNSFSQWAADP